MNHDPFYAQIIERLNGNLDPNQFEACVVDLLRTHDGLFAVPILGGGDSGMDGAVADWEGEPFPIVTTTSDDVSGNLTRYLKRYKADGGTARKCIVATSRKLTTRRLDYLTKCATGLEFTLVQRLERSAIAARLYHDSKWCKELLHLTGKPSALSVIPLTRRPLPEHELVGRDDTIQWLHTLIGDSLLVGEPGAGKTSLLYEFAIDEENQALFVVSHNQGEIANAVRDQQPKVVIVDDAHTDIEFIAKLLRLRQEIRGDFEILATSWNGDGPEIAQILNAAPENVHELKRLTRDEIAEVVINADINPNHWLVNEIVRQAEGLPGLAGTLTYFALQGRWREIYTGEALATDITRFYKNRIKGDVAGLLSCFALGGNSGMGKDTVSETLNMPVHQLRQDLANLAHGGIIAEVPNRKDYIKVRPSALRHALIRDIFFSGPSSLPETCLHKLFAAAPEDVDTVREFIDVARRWGNVPPRLIQNPLKEFIAEIAHWTNRLPLSPLGYSTPTLEAVREYTWLGPGEAHWVIDNFTASLSHIARPLLEHVPERVIPRLLHEAIGDTRPLNSNTEHPLRLLQDWIKQAYPGTLEPLQRRAKILHATKTWLSGDHDPSIGYSAMLLAVLPHFEFTEDQPGSSGSIKIYHGFLIYEHLLKLQEFWEEIIECTRVHTVLNWEEFLNTVGSWAYPFFGNGPDENSRKMMTDFAQRMALDVAKAAENRVGVIHQLKALMDRSFPELEISTNDLVSILYPDWNIDVDRAEQEVAWRQAVENLALSWATREPTEVVAELEPIEKDMQNGRGWHDRYTPNICLLLAEAAESPLEWFEVFVNTSLPADTVAPFLKTAIQRGLDGWKVALNTCFETERLKPSAIKITLTLEHAPSEFMSRALKEAAQQKDLIDRLARLRQLSHAATLQLLSHSDRQLAGRVAIAIWRQQPRGDIPEEISQLWEKAIVEYANDDYWLAIILSAEPELGKKWLLQKMIDETPRPYIFKQSMSAVSAQLDSEERKAYLGLVPDRYGWDEMISLLVGDSAELFEALLGSGKQVSYKLCPLGRPTIDVTWIALAKLAHKHNHSIEEIVYCAFGNSVSWSGKYSDVLKSQYEQFEAYRNDEDETVRQIAEIGYAIYFSQYIEQKKREDDEDVHGRD